METRPLHQNLDTSFVNVSALVNYLRRRQFSGLINIELNGYKAEIGITKENQLAVTERDEISGRVSKGKEAYQRLLIRSREPGGSVNVYQYLEGADSSPAGSRVSLYGNKKALSRVEVTAIKQSASKLKDQPIPKPDSRELNSAVANTTRNVRNAIPVTVVEPVGVAVEEKTPVSKPSLPDFPFELSNNFERKAKRQKLSFDDWQTMMKLTVELLGVLDRTLANHGLDFEAAFTKVRSEIATDYPFMNPAEGVFKYQAGRIEMTRKVNEAVFVISISESIRRIVGRLGQNQKFAEPYRQASHVLLALMDKRKAHYDKFGFTNPLKRILGV